jgi:hypothetical protein
MITLSENAFIWNGWVAGRLVANDLQNWGDIIFEFYFFEKLQCCMW